MLVYSIITLIVIGYVLNVLVLYKYNQRGLQQEHIPLAFIPFLAFLGHTIIVSYYAVFLNRYEGFWGIK